MIRLMALGNITSWMGIDTRANFSKEKDMAMVPISITLETVTKETGNMIWKKAQEKWPSTMEMCTLVNGCMVKRKVKDNTIFRMDSNMWVHSIKTPVMEKVYFVGRTVVAMLVIGIKIIWMVSASIETSMGLQLKVFLLMEIWLMIRKYWLSMIWNHTSKPRWPDWSKWLLNVLIF